jgi:hypothetical protein
LQVGGGTVAASASHDGNNTYTTEVSESPTCWNLTIGHTLPAGAGVQSVTLDGQPVNYQTVDTTRGREVRVATSTGGLHELVVTTS